VRGTVTSKCTRRHKKADKRCSSRCLRWYYVLCSPPGHEGPRKRQWSTGFATKREAEQALIEELARRDQGIILSGEKITVHQFAQRWLDHMAMLGRDERTLERYRELLELHALPTIGGLQVRALQPHQLSALYARLLTQGRRDGKPGGLKSRTVGHVHRALHRMLRQAVRWRLIALNPANDLELPAVVDEPMVTLTHQQARMLLQAARPRRWLYVLILLGVATGARLGELLALRWTEVDLERGTVRIGRSRRVVNGRMQVKGPKTEAGYRTVTIGVITIAELGRLRAEQVRQRLALGRHYYTAEALADLQARRAPLPARQRLNDVPRIRRPPGPAQDGACAHAAAFGRVVPGCRRGACLRYRRAAWPCRRWDAGSAGVCASAGGRPGPLARTLTRWSGSGGDRGRGPPWSGLGRCRSAC